MSYLCIKKQEPTAGAKGIMCGGVFLPIESYKPEHPTPASQIPSEGLALYVPLSEAPNASEWAGYGSITYKTVDGVPCAYFNGDNGNGLYSDKEFEMPAFTVSIVFNTKSFSPTLGDMPYLVNFGPNSTNDNLRLALRLDNYYSGNKNALAMVYYGYYLVIQNLSADTWYSAQMKFDGNQISLYLNGELQLQTNVSLKKIQSEVWIGKSPSGDGAFNGYLSSLRVYNRALTDAEIALLAREFVFNSAPLAGRKGLLVPVGESVSAPPANGLVFYAPLSEESSTAETGQALTKSGTVTYQTVEGLPCARFDTKYSYLSATVPNMAGVLTGTISIWIYISGNAGGDASTYPTFFTFGDKSKPYGGFILGTWATREGEINYQTNSTGNEWPSASNPLIKGQWINFIATITESGTLQSYVNGNSGGVCETGTITISDPSVYINYADLSYGVDGIYIADVRMYNRILSASEIQSLAFEHNPTKSLFIPLKTAYGTPQAGQKGIIVRSSQVVGHALYSKSAEAMPTEGLVFHASLSEESSTAETGQALTKNGTITYETLLGIPCITKGDTDACLSAPLSVEGVFTLSFWIKTTYTGEYIGMAYVGELCIFDTLSNPNFQFSAKKNYSERVNFQGISKPFKWRDGSWHHIALSITSTESKLYCDGTLISTASGVNISASSSHAYIGWDNDGDNAAASYAQFRIFNRALTDAEIKLLAGEYKPEEVKKMFIAVKEQSAIPEDGLIFYAPLQENKSTAETGQALTKSGNVTYGTESGIPCAFTNGNGYLSFSASGLITMSSDWTISLWIRFNSFSGQYPTPFAMGERHDVGTALRVIYFSGKLCFEPVSSDPSTSPIIEPALNVWYHICIVHSGSLTTMYSDGVQENQKSFTYSFTPSSGDIGNSLNLNEYFNGWISAVRIYNRALDADEISALANEYAPEA